MQGVTAEDLKAADAQAKQSAATGVGGGITAPTTTAAPATISYLPPANNAVKTPLSSSTVSKDEEKENLAKPNSTASFSRLTIPLPNSDNNNTEIGSKLRPLTIPASPDAIITLPLRKSKPEDGKKRVHRFFLLDFFSEEVLRNEIVNFKKKSVIFPIDFYHFFPHLFKIRKNRS